MEISGCRFKYHQEPSSASLVVLDESRIPMARIDIAVSKLDTGDDVYEMNSTVINSYDVMGSYFFCELRDDAKVLISNFSAKVDVACKF